MLVEGLSMPAAVTATVLITFVFVAGNAGNVLFCLVFKRSWKLHTWENAFHVNITLANVIAINVTGLTFILLMWHADTESRAYVTSCQLFITSFAALLTILGSHAAIAILRCVKVCRPDLIVGRRFIVLGLAVCWATGLLFLLHVHLTGTGILFNTQCHLRPIRTTSVRVSVIVILLTFLLTLLTSYVVTFWKLKRTNRIQPMPGYASPPPQPPPPTPTGSMHSSKTSVDTAAVGIHVVELSVAKVESGVQNNQETLRYIIRSNVIQFVSFVASGGLSLLASIFASAFPAALGGATLSVGVVTFSFIFLAFVLNPLIYCVRNKRFRGMADSLFNCLNRSG